MDYSAERFSGSYPAAIDGEAPNAFVSVAESASADSAPMQEAFAAQKEKNLQLAADFESFRKRTRRDSEQQAAAEKESFIRELLPALDNLERALASEESASSEQLRRGVEMTLQQLGRLLHNHGIEAVDAVGQLFDPHRHEAVSLGHDPSRADQIVLEVVQRGYRRGERMFRPAKVVVNDPRHSRKNNRAR